MNEKLKHALMLSIFISHHAAYAGSGQYVEANAIDSHPAEIALIDKIKVYGGFDFLYQHDKYRGTAQTIVVPPITTNVIGTPANSSAQFFLPSMFIAAPVNDKFSIGVGYSTPQQFTDSVFYNESSIFRYNYTTAKFHTQFLKTVFAYKLMENLSVAAGFYAAKLDLEFNVAVPSDLSGMPTNDNMIKNSASGWGQGWIASILVDIPKTFTRLEASYQSKANVTINGTSEFFFENANVVLAKNNGFQVPVTAPAKFRFKIVQPLSKQLFLVGVYWYTTWSTIDTLPFRNLAFPTGPVTSNLTFKWKNISTYVLAARYNFKENLYASIYGGRRDSQYFFANHFYVAGIEGGYTFTNGLTAIAQYKRNFDNTYKVLPVRPSVNIMNGQVTTNRDEIGIKLAYSFDNPKSESSK